MIKKDSYPDKLDKFSSDSQALRNLIRLSEVLDTFQHFYKARSLILEYRDWGHFSRASSPLEGERNEFQASKSEMAWSFLLKEKKWNFFIK